MNFMTLLSFILKNVTIFVTAIVLAIVLACSCTCDLQL
jgi:hypothetical protein